MGFAPLPDPLHVGRVPEVIAIGRLTQPAPLTGGLAGATASRCATVKLASPVMGVRREEKTAARALAAAGGEIHRAPSRKKMRRAGQSKNLQPQGRTREEGRKNLGLKAEENPKEENGISNRQDYPTFISPLTGQHPCRIQQPLRHMRRCLRRPWRSRCRPRKPRRRPWRSRRRAP